MTVQRCWVLNLDSTCLILFHNSVGFKYMSKQFTGMYVVCLLLCAFVHMQAYPCVTYTCMCMLICIHIFLCVYTCMYVQRSTLQKCTPPCIYPALANQDFPNNFFWGWNTVAGVQQTCKKWDFYNNDICMSVCVCMYMYHGSSGVPMYFLFIMQKIYFI